MVKETIFLEVFLDLRKHNFVVTQKLKFFHLILRRREIKLIIFFKHYWNFKGEYGHSFLTMLQSQITSHFLADFFATGESEAYVIILGLDDANAVFQFQKRNK